MSAQILFRFDSGRYESLTVRLCVVVPLLTCTISMRCMPPFRRVCFRGRKRAGAGMRGGQNWDEVIADNDIIRTEICTHVRVALRGSTVLILP